MNLIKRLFLLIALVLTIFCSNIVNASDIQSSDNFGGAIYAVKNYENDFLNSKNNELSLSASNCSQGSASIRRKNNSSSSSGVSCDFVNIYNFKNYKNLNSNNKISYLKNDLELALQLLFYQVQPNAP